MATITKRGDMQWQAKVRRKGHPTISKTFELKENAEKWARGVESDMERSRFIDRRAAETTLLKEIIEIYRDKVTPTKKGASRELPRIKMWLNSNLASKPLAAIKPKDIADFRDAERARGLAENTIRINILLLSSIFKHAFTELSIEAENPCGKIKLPKPSNKRARRLSVEEIDALFSALPLAMPKTKHIRELAELALETGMRQSEILKIEWCDVKLKEKTIILDDTKSGDSRAVPLSPRAIFIIASIPRPPASGKLFYVTQDALIRGFVRACKIAKESIVDATDGFLENVKFHDLRHEAASRIASTLSAHELCKMFGWKSMTTALRYYHPDGTTIAEKLARAAPLTTNTL